MEGMARLDPSKVIKYFSQILVNNDVRIDV